MYLTAKFLRISFNTTEQCMSSITLQSFIRGYHLWLRPNPQLSNVLDLYCCFSGRVGPRPREAAPKAETLRPPAIHSQSTPEPRLQGFSFCSHSDLLLGSCHVLQISQLRCCFGGFPTSKEHGHGGERVNVKVLCQ